MDKRLINTVEWLSNAQKNAGIGIWYQDVFSDMLWWSDQTYRIFGMEPQCEEMCFDKFIEMVDVEYHEEIIEKTRKLLQIKDFEYNVDYVVNSKDGNQRLIHEEALMERDDSDNPIQIVGIVKDVTEQKKAEQELIRAKEEAELHEKKFRLLFENSPLGTYIADVNGKILDVNQTALDQLGSPSKEATKQINVLKYPPLIENGYVDKFLECVNTGEIITLELFYKTKWGKQIFLSSYIVPLKDSTGKIGRIYTIMEDITEKKKSEQALKKSESELRESNNTKDKFLSIIAHDLISPFNSLLGFSNMLVDKFDDRSSAQNKKYIKIINQQVYKTLKLIENLLLWSRTQTGSITFKPEKCNLQQIVNEVYELLKCSAQAKSIVLVNRVLVDVCVDADKFMLSTILRNLISNSIKFSSKGDEIVIDCEVIVYDDKQRYIKMQISDTGVGISEDKIKDLFRIDKNTSTLGTDKEAGTGLGLILCKEFVDKHNGKIWVESEFGKGSVFSFIIPHNV